MWILTPTRYATSREFFFRFSAHTVVPFLFLPTQLNPSSLITFVLPTLYGFLVLLAVPTSHLVWPTVAPRILVFWPATHWKKKDLFKIHVHCWLSSPLLFLFLNSVCRCSYQRHVRQHARVPNTNQIHTPSPEG